MITKDNHKKTLPLPQTRTALAQMYNVSVRAFNKWISINKQLQAILKPYADNNTKVLPPKVVADIIEVLGEP